MKQKKLYLDSGYLDFTQIIDDRYPITFLIGGRATGKTYGGLQYGKEYHDDYGKLFFYMRRTAKKAELISTDAFNPFKPLNQDLGWNIYPESLSKGISAFQNESGEIYGIIAALSTFSNFRGFDGSNVDLIFLDEFIKEPTEKAIRNEAFALMNVYETINRNRELRGEKPVKLICMSNSNEIANDIFIGFRVVAAAEQMIKRDRNQWYIPDRGIAIYNLTDSPISTRKADTALYRMDQGGEYSNMALKSKYQDYDTSNIRNVPLVEYRPEVHIGELYIYQHKSERQFYISFHRSGTMPEYSLSQIDRERFVRQYIYLWEAYLQGRVLFESFYCKKLFEDIFY